MVDNFHFNAKIHVLTMKQDIKKTSTFQNS